MSSKEDGNSSGADETSLKDETGSRVSVELGFKVDTSSKVKDLDLEIGSEIIESESKINTSFKASSKDLDLVDKDLDFADNSLDLEKGLDSVDKDLDLKISLDLEKNLDFDGGGYWSRSDNN